MMMILMMMMRAVITLTFGITFITVLLSENCLVTSRAVQSISLSCGAWLSHRFSSREVKMEDVSDLRSFLGRSSIRLHPESFTKLTVTRGTNNHRSFHLSIKKLMIMLP